MVVHSRRKNNCESFYVLTFESFIHFQLFFLIVFIHFQLYFHIRNLEHRHRTLICTTASFIGNLLPCCRRLRLGNTALNHLNLNSNLRDARFGSFRVKILNCWKKREWTEGGNKKVYIPSCSDRRASYVHGKHIPALHSPPQLVSNIYPRLRRFNRWLLYFNELSGTVLNTSVTLPSPQKFGAQK